MAAALNHVEASIRDCLAEPLTECQGEEPIVRTPDHQCGRGDPRELGSNVTIQQLTGRSEHAPRSRSHAIGHQEGKERRGQRYECSTTSKTKYQLQSVRG